MRRVLFISFDFPPRRTSAVYRHVGLTRYLTRFGWRPTVLTVREIAGDVEDRTLLDRLPPDVEVVRTGFLRLHGWEVATAAFFRRLKGWFRGTAQATAPGAQAAPSAAAADPPQKKHGPVYEALKRLGEMVQLGLYFPDHTAGWIPMGCAEGIRQHLKKRFDLIYTSSPPRSAPVIGLLLKLLFGVPWVAEFRDPWYPPPGHHPWRRRAERWLQLRILRRADAVVVISRGHAEELISPAYGLPAAKVKVISNGFDEEDFRAGDDAKPTLLEPGYVHLSHFGTVYPRFCGSFFSALAELARSRPEVREQVRVNIIGFPEDEELLRYAEGELKDIIRLRGFLPHGDAIQAMRESHYLLLFLGDPKVSRLSGLGKIYWYLRVGRPILAVAPEGGTQELVEEGHAGWVVPPDDRAGIRELLGKLVSPSPNGYSAHIAAPEFVARFRYDRLAGELAAVMNGVAAHER